MPSRRWGHTGQLFVCGLAFVCAGIAAVSQAPLSPVHIKVCRGVGNTFNASYVSAITACYVAAPLGASAVHVGRPDCELRAGLFRCAVTVTYQPPEASRHEGVFRLKPQSRDNTP